mgnify:FL=1
MSIIDSIKSSIFVPIHPAGTPFVILFCLITLIFGWIWYPLFFIGLVLTIWCIYFFRNPNRVIPDSGKDSFLVLAPADGKIVEISKTVPDDEIGLPKTNYIKIGIFMNVFNVHVNRSPMSGKITNKNYIPGLFFNATLDKASKENERMSLVMDFDKNKKIAFVQIAGLVARRIITEVEIGSELKMGEVFGLIRFGSRVDVYYPEEAVTKVLKGQTAIAGETVIAELKKTKIIKKSKK